MQLGREALLEGLVEHGFWLTGDVPGLVGRTRRFEAIVEGFVTLIGRSGSGGDGRSDVETVRFPPVLDREILRRTGYMENFPDLCGSIHHYRPERGKHRDLVDRVEAGGDWSEFLEPTALTLCPAACYPLYATFAGAVVPETGRLFDVHGWVFRSEPSPDPARLQAFRVHEIVFVGAPAPALGWRDASAVAAQTMLRSLGLDATLQIAADPFFGRAGRLMAASQLEDELKFEIVVPVSSDGEPTAVCSFNCHETKFADVYDLKTAPDGHRAHTACLGYGLERVALALIATHGFDVAAWPKDVRDRLSLDASPTAAGRPAIAARPPREGRRSP